MSLDRTPSVATSFAELGLRPQLLQAIVESGYETPTPIQAQAIPVLLTGKDVIGKARTGTGKTAAFSLPLLERIDVNQPHVQALVLCPTRELAIQVADAMQAYARRMSGLRVLAVYGGQSMGPQLKALRGPVHVVVGTPGRILDHIRRETLRLENVNTVVLDEADEMLRMGFIDDVESILSETPTTRLTALFSATMPPEVAQVARRHLTAPVTVAVMESTQATIEQRFIRLRPRQRFLALHRILLSEPCEGMLVFVRTRQDCSDLTEDLLAHGHRAEALHGDLSQAQRELVMTRFRENHVQIVVATDVAARGLDVDHITHVVNFDLPQDLATYTHRIGRTGRAGRQGVAILFLYPQDMRLVQRIQAQLKITMNPMEVPTAEEVAHRQAERFKERVREVLAQERLELQYRMVKELAEEGLPMTGIAAAAAFLGATMRSAHVKGQPEEWEERPVRAEQPERTHHPGPRNKPHGPGRAHPQKRQTKREPSRP